MRHIILIFIPLFIFLSCEQKKETYSLKEKGEILSFPIDNQTRNYSKALFFYQDNNGKEYLTFQNQGKNEILLYDLKSCQLESKIKYEIEGENGVGFMWGYYIHNLDSIFLTSRDLQEIYLTNSKGEVKDKYSYEQSTDSIDLGIYCSISFISIPMILRENKLFIMPSCNRHINPNPICATIDLKTKEINTFPYSYPTFPNTNNKQKRAGIELYVSRCFNDINFIYSFFYDENLYVLSQNHENLKKIKANSSYFEKVTVPDDYGNTTFKEMCEIPNYGNILYDKYRDVYYRIAYPKTEIDKKIKPLELMDFGRKSFSIITLDKDFKIIGETLFPDYTYNSSLMFITKEGLYISCSHYLNSEFNDDVLSFKCFKLTKD